VIGMRIKMILWKKLWISFMKYLLNLAYLTKMMMH